MTYRKFLNTYRITNDTVIFACVEEDERGSVVSYYDDEEKAKEVVIKEWVNLTNTQKKQLHVFAHKITPDRIDLATAKTDAEHWYDNFSSNVFEIIWDSEVGLPLNNKQRKVIEELERLYLGIKSMNAYRRAESFEHKLFLRECADNGSGDLDERIMSLFPFTPFERVSIADENDMICETDEVKDDIRSFVKRIKVIYDLTDHRTSTTQQKYFEQ